MNYVRYIDKTRDYYGKVGYAQEYRWARFEDGPFTPLRKPLAESKAVLISTAALVTLDAQGNPTEEAMVIGTNKMEVFPLHSDWPVEALRSMSEDHDRFQTDMSDVNAFFPISRMRDLVDAGDLGSLAPTFYRLVPNYSQRKILKVDAPEVLERCRQEEVDIALLTPV